MVEKVLANPWFFSFAVSWIVFFLLVDWKNLLINIWGGIFSSAYQLIQDTNAVLLNFYHFNDIGIRLFKTSFFFTFGIAFTMGIIFMQFLPKKPKLQLIYISGFTLGFLGFEAILIKFKLLSHTKHWSLYGSIFDNILIFANFTWLNNQILNPLKKEK